MRRRSSRSRTHAPVTRDIGIIVLSVLIALILVRTDVLVNILTSTKELEVVGSLIAGMFFTSIFTTAPAIVTLGELSQANSLILVALMGGLGAVIGDLIIFRFVKDQLSEHMVDLLRENGTFRRTRKLFRNKMFRWLTFFVGGFVLASPLPDELGVSILGAAHMKTSRFMLISFVFNSLGILVIGLIARSML